MRQVQIFINDQLLDLFDDENILVTSSIQNISDIAKVFTDFSQQFTVPATKRNNTIFQHYYNNDLDGTFQARVRQPARIDINFATFRKGKIQLEGAEIVQNQAQHYVITFFGDVVSLKDLFGGDKLRDLDYGILEQIYNFESVRDSITSTASLDVRYPLISSDRVWEYGSGGSNNIEVSGGAINFIELFPAVRAAKVLELIEDYYGVTFVGNFLTDTRFTNLYTWWKNSDEVAFTTQPLSITFNPDGNTCIPQLVPFNSGIFTNEVRLRYVNAYNFVPDFNGAAFHSINILIGNTSSNDVYFIDVFINGIISYTVTGEGANTFNIVQNVPNMVGLNDTYTFEARALNTPVNFNIQISYNFDAQFVDFSISPPEQDVLELSCSFETLGNVMTAFVNFNNTAPDITIVDYFSGLLRMFNLTCYPEDAPLTFQVEPLEMWYRYGIERDITEFVDVQSIKVDRPKLYNNIEFNYKPSKSFMNLEYKENNNKEYGSLRNFFGYDGGDFKIDLPFETLLFNKFDNTPLQVGYSLETVDLPDNKPVIPKCTQLYLYPETQSVSFFLTDGSTPEELTTYMPFGQDSFYNLEEYTINFNEEISSLTLDPEPNSLYRTYYQEYLANLFSDKTRILTIKCILPLPLLEELELNDALIIRDKKYRINEQKVNITNGDVELVLITDSSVNRPRIIPVLPSIPVDGGSVVVPVKPIKPGSKVTIKIVGGESIDIFDEDNVLIAFGVNTTGEDKNIVYELEYYDENKNLVSTEYLFFEQNATDDFLLQEDDHFLLQENLFKIFL